MITLTYLRSYFLPFFFSMRSLRCLVSSAASGETADDEEVVGARRFLRTLSVSWDSVASHSESVLDSVGSWEPFSPSCEPLCFFERPELTGARSASLASPAAAAAPVVERVAGEAGGAAELDETLALLSCAVALAGGGFVMP